MYVAHDFGLVRIVYDGDAFTTTYDVRVEWMRNGMWELYHGINSLSDDYAITNAKEMAGRAIKKLASETAGVE